eukprot:GHVN01039354.1.p1 GENE.GHVN01039354.1~~GHVN01039354.1.p1  ORF type:complete len:354 (-),score=60.59 GHVN01039354.1:2632-3693(-)
MCMCLCLLCRSLCKCVTCTACRLLKCKPCCRVCGCVKSICRCCCPCCCKKEDAIEEKSREIDVAAYKKQHEKDRGIDVTGVSQGVPQPGTVDYKRDSKDLKDPLIVKPSSNASGARNGGKPQPNNMSSPHGIPVSHSSQPKALSRGSSNKGAAPFQPTNHPQLQQIHQQAHQTAHKFPTNSQTQTVYHPKSEPVYQHLKQLSQEARAHEISSPSAPPRPTAGQYFTVSQPRQVAHQSSQLEQHSQQPKFVLQPQYLLSPPQVTHSGSQQLYSQPQYSTQQQPESANPQQPGYQSHYTPANQQDLSQYVTTPQQQPPQGQQGYVTHSHGQPIVQQQYYQQPQDEYRYVPQLQQG